MTVSRVFSVRVLCKTWLLLSQFQCLCSRRPTAAAAARSAAVRSAAASASAASVNASAASVAIATESSSTVQLLRTFLWQVILYVSI